MAESSKKRSPQSCPLCGVPHASVCSGVRRRPSMYRGERSSSLTRPLRGLILTALQGSAATIGMESNGIWEPSQSATGTLCSV